MNPEQANQVGKELTTAQWIDLAKQSQEQGMVFALLTGGEPFIRKDFFEIYNAMKDMGIIISINTNGSLLDGEIRQQLLENPPNRMNISLYGGCRETYRNMCGQDAFDRVLGNIRALKDAGVDIRLNVSITPYNRQDIQKIFDISRELNVHVKQTSYMYPPIRVNGGQVGCGNRLTAQEAARCAVEWDLLRFAPEQFAQRAVNMKARIAAEEKECAADPDIGVSCRAGYSSFWMTWDGRMLPCGMMPSPEAYPLEVGFKAAWEQIRKQTREIRMPTKCAACDKKSLCAVCAAVCVTETGAFDRVPEYVCRQTEEMIRATWEAYEERYGK
jgi:radical SAM protein with 4Fe4S-binding SPASM domain